MRTYITYLLLTVCTVFFGCSKKYADYSLSSGFERTQIDSTTLENLEVLGRVWGYVKYHHPAFAGNKYNLDFELFELLPQVVDADPIERNRILASWIDGFGAFRTTQEKYDAIPVSDSLYEYRTDVGWIRDTARLGTELSERLERLRIADRKKENYYVFPTVGQMNGVKFQIDNPCFDNEKPYMELSDPDYGYRLLAVFRFWNMVEYFFPTKYLTDKDWNDVLPEYIGRMVQPVDNDYRKEAWRMIAETNDNHAQWNRIERFGEYRAPVDVGFVENRLIVISPDTVPIYYERQSAFEIGDEIIAVAGKLVAHYLAQTREFVPCSNQNDLLAATADIILRSKINRQLRVSYLREGVRRDTLLPEMERMRCDFKGTYLQKNIDAYKLLADSIGYIYPAKYSNSDKNQIAKMLSNSKGLVIDLRCYPTRDFFDFMCTHIIPYELAEQSALFSYPVFDVPGIFSFTHSTWSRLQIEKYDRNIVILVNETTQSAAETSVQMMQNNPKVCVIGSQSAGANGNISRFILPGNIQSCFSGLGWYYPDGWCVQRQGVKIDMEVRQTIDGVKAGRDELLEEAIAFIRQEPELPENPQTE